jgi:hypothetical protein
MSRSGYLPYLDIKKRYPQSTTTKSVMFCLPFSKAFKKGKKIKVGTTLKLNLAIGRQGRGGCKGRGREISAVLSALEDYLARTISMRSPSIGNPHVP